MNPSEPSCSVHCFCRVHIGTGWCPLEVWCSVFIKHKATTKRGLVTVVALPWPQRLPIQRRCSFSANCFKNTTGGESPISLNPSRGSSERMADCHSFRYMRRHSRDRDCCAEHAGLGCCIFFVGKYRLIAAMLFTAAVPITLAVVCMWLYLDSRDAHYSRLENFVAYSTVLLGVAGVLFGLGILSQLWPALFLTLTPLKFQSAAIALSGTCSRSIKRFMG